LSSANRTWHVFLAYQVANAFCYLFNCQKRYLPHITQLALFLSLGAFVVIIITVPATAPTHQSAKFVFANFINSTGWSNNGIAFIVGLINTNWAFACLDAATHLAEEIPRPERAIPFAILGTVAIGFVTSWTYSVVIFFSTNGDFEHVVSALVPILVIFEQALNSNAGALALECLVIAASLGCMVSCHTWQSRLCWSFARDAGLPGHRWLAQVHPVLEVPLYAHTVSCALTAIVGLLYLVSQTAFNR
jgi:choline transport protein